MRAKERELIRQAIRYLNADEGAGGDYDKGMAILCELVGIPHLGDVLKNGEAVSILDMAIRPDQSFRVKG